MDFSEKRKKLLGAVSSLCSAAIFVSFAASSSPLVSPPAPTERRVQSGDEEPFSLEVCAAPEAQEIAKAFTASFKAQDYPLFVNGRAFPYTTQIVGGEYCVFAEDFLSFAGIECEVGAEDGARVFTVNGRCRPAFCGAVRSECGASLPLFELCTVLGLEAETKESGVFVTGDKARIIPGDEFYDPEDLFWLSRIIRAESETEPLEGKIAVGNVVLNRVRSDSFPDDVKGVVFDKRLGVAQFSPASTGAILVEPDAESIAAAKLCLEGVSLSDKIIFFMNPALATSSWISDNRPAVMTIGNHTFYS